MTERPVLVATTMGRWRTLLLMGTPLVTFLTVAVGLRLGAGSGFRYAEILGGPPSGGQGKLVWQVRTYFQDSGVREMASGLALDVRMGHASKDEVQSVVTNEDGIAELAFAGPQDAARTVPVQVVMVGPQKGTHEVLAEGSVAIPRPYPVPSGPEEILVKPTHSEGALQLRVAVPGQKIHTGGVTDVWAQVVAEDGRPLANASVKAEPEEGLRIAESAALRCESGWHRFGAEALGHLAGLRLRAQAPDGRTGLWYGALNVAPGATTVSLDQPLVEGALMPVQARAPLSRPRAYLEIIGPLGRMGREYATPLRFGGSATGDALANVQLPPLSPGVHWLRTSADAFGTEEFAAGIWASPFLVRGAREATNPCEFGPRLATLAPPSAPKELLLDGSLGKLNAMGRRRTQGRTLALGALLVGALLELALVVTKPRQRHDGHTNGKVHVAHKEDQGLEPGEELGLVGLGPPPRLLATALVGLAITLMGFALFALFIVTNEP